MGIPSEWHFQQRVITRHWVETPYQEVEHGEELARGHVHVVSKPAIHRSVTE